MISLSFPIGHLLTVCIIVNHRRESGMTVPRELLRCIPRHEISKKDEDKFASFARTAVTVLVLFSPSIQVLDFDFSSSQSFHFME
jgi:hypothetical protein